MAELPTDMADSVSSSALLVDAPTPESDDVDSLPESGETSSTEEEQDLYASDAEREWKESLQQLELLLTMVLIPYFGKYFGRKFAYYSWARFMEWKYPVEVKITSPGEFRATGIAAAAAL